MTDVLLRERISFEELVPGAESTLGNTQKTPTHRFYRRACFLFLRSGEGVLAGRLSGTQSIVMTVRRSAAVAAITTTQTTKWQIRDKTTDIVYNIKAVEPNREKPRQLIDFLCVSTS
ncbi:head-tail adaptor protein [Shimia sagamensis]|uniref:Phage head-tail joining protein n=1 Tax=Shimia sagamensis TaxID=1566352 RepID=A0ABY1PE29_9RHOB|nr:head-tail adaptor protein [Shimia sagamensis]SMP32170.1 Phage head-tail joining protein [Shimia sagamensis]